MIEQRGSERKPGTIWVHVVGADKGAKLRRGNVSRTGIFFAADSEVGAPGTVQVLGLAPANRSFSVMVMARVVRVVAMQDIWSGNGISGIALEFMPEDEQKQAALQELFTELTSSASGPGNADAPASKEGDKAAGAIRVQKLDRRKLTLETDWQVRLGEDIHCDISAPSSGHMMHAEGKAVAVSAFTSNATKRYRVDVEFNAEASSNAEGTSLQDAMAMLLEETLVLNDKDPRSTEFLTGDLGTIQLPNLLTHMYNSQLTGVLKLRNDAERASIFLREGFVRSIEHDGVGSPQDRLGSVLDWTHGDFRFVGQVTAEAEHFDVKTPTLLDAVGHPCRDSPV